MKPILQQYQEAASASLDQAHSLPFGAYSDSDVFQQEALAVFSNEWVFVCCEQELVNPGDYFALNLAGEPVVILRGKDGMLRALSNICRHRGTPLLNEGFGQVEKLIVCPYHAWSYDDQGSLKGVPFPGRIAVDKKEHCLPEFHLDIWCGLVFINLSNNPQPLHQRLEGIDGYLEVFEPSAFDTAFEGQTEHWQSNWKLAMENAMESYHLFKVHKETLEQVTPTKQAFYVAGSSEWTLTAGKMIDQSSKLTKWLRGNYPEAYDHYVLVSLPPSFVGIMDYESFGWLCVLPDGEGQSVVRSGYLAKGASSKESKEAQAFTKAFFAEDKWICERVQKGMQARFGKGGKLVEMEKVVVDFHQFLASRLFGSQVDEFFESEQARIFTSNQ